MQHSEQVNELFTALSKALGEIESLPLNKTNPHFKSKYADLAITIEKSKPALMKNGLMLIQAVENDEIKYVVESMITHSSGQWLKSKVALILTKQDMQGLGSATTYAKRYAAQSLLFVAGDEDDDGNAASAGAPQQGKAQRQQPPAKAQPPSDKKPPQAPPAKPPQNAPADQATMDRLLDLMIDRGVHENSITNLISKGYGFRADKPPMWVALEVGALLENEDTTDATIERKFKEVLKRREAAGKGGPNA